MAKERSTAAARLAAALTSFKKALTSNNPNIGQWRKDVSAAGQSLMDVWNELRQDCPQDLPPTPVLNRLDDFLYRDINPVYLWGDIAATALPCPPSFLQKVQELIVDFGGPKARRPAIAMTAEDELILTALADAYPAAVTQPDLAGLTGLPRQKISARLRWLESKRLVKRPEGTQRKGHAIIPAGMSAIGRQVDGPH